MKSEIKKNPIGIFDSGVGGLTVVKCINKFLPNEDVIYFGDTARVPYGSKSNSTVIEYSIQNTEFLKKKNVKLIIVACNTASAVALEELKKKFDIPIIGMIEPGANMALSKTTNNNIGVIGTDATINNKAYSKQLKNISNRINVFEKACPLFAPLAEEGWIEHSATYEIAKEYLTELKSFNIDTLILGCTHYPILTEVISSLMGSSVNLIDSGTAASVVVKEYLEKNNLVTEKKHKGKNKFFVSDMPIKFKRIAELFLGTKINNIEKIDLEEITKE